MLNDTALKLDPREEHYRIPSHHEGLSLFLHRLAPDQKRPAKGVVLYVHGATFPSGLSIAHRFDGRSWRDELCAAGFDVWGLDFHGFGCLSDPYPAMNEPAEQSSALGRAEDASRQLEQAVRFITAHHGVDRISLIAHSWGTMAVGRFAGRCPELVDRLVFFGPITWRQKTAESPHLPAWQIVTPAEQWNRFVQDVPAGHPPVLLKRHFDAWGELYLDCDPKSRTRVPAGVKIPLGPLQDIADAWAGDLAYEPSLIRAPVAILRGEWDSLSTDADARWLFAALTAAPTKRDVKISKGGHLMHLEECRYALYREAACFLLARDVPRARQKPIRRRSPAEPQEHAVFCVIFEVNPKPDQKDAYLGHAKLLRPELVKVDGFIDNFRYESKRRPGWLLSLSTWRYEKALVGWRKDALHHEVQQKGRLEVFQDYRIRVGQITADSHVPEGHILGNVLSEERLDEMETGAAKFVSIIEMRRPDELPQDAPFERIANRLGLSVGAEGLAEWDVFDAILTPDDFLFLASWRSTDDATQRDTIPAEARLRKVCILRDYGMFERTEAPQYYPDILPSRQQA